MKCSPLERSKHFYNMKRWNYFNRFKGFTILVNLVLLSFGLAIMTVGLCHKSYCFDFFDKDWYLQIVEESKMYFEVTLFRVSSAMLVVGVQMILLGILGCYGTWNDSLCILGISIMFLIILMVEELTVIVWPVAYKDGIKKALDTVVMNDYHKNVSSVIKHFDTIQKKLQCCGSVGPRDWEKMIIPKSCCKNASSQVCEEYIDSVERNELNELNDTIINIQVTIMYYNRFFHFVYLYIYIYIYIYNALIIFK